MMMDSDKEIECCGREEWIKRGIPPPELCKRVLI